MSTSAITALAYYSSRTEVFDGDVGALAARAAAKNAMLGTTGFLTFRRGMFVQYLESADAVALTDLMGRIEADERHQVNHIVMLGTIPSPRFPDWSMRDLDVQAAADITLDNILEEMLTSVRASHLSQDTSAVDLINDVIDKMSGPA